MISTSPEERLDTKPDKKIRRRSFLGIIAGVAASIAGVLHAEENEEASIGVPRVTEYYALKEGEENTELNLEKVGNRIKEVKKKLDEAIKESAKRMDPLKKRIMKLVKDNLPPDVYAERERLISEACKKRPKFKLYLDNPERGMIRALFGNKGREFIELIDLVSEESRKVNKEHPMVTFIREESEKRRIKKYRDAARKLEGQMPLDVIIEVDELREKWTSKNAYFSDLIGGLEDELHDLRMEHFKLMKTKIQIKIDQRKWEKRRDV